jgi:hypothetical protein
MLKPSFKVFILAAGFVPLAIVGALYIGWFRLNEKHYRQFLPVEFQDFKLVNCYDSFRLQDIPTLLLPIRHESSGCAIFEVTPQWINKIDKEGISAFQALTKSKNQHLFYQWKGTPVSWRDSNTLSGAWSGLDQASQKLQHAIMRKLIEPGSFACECNGSFLVVIPSLKWVIFTYCH